MDCLQTFTNKMQICIAYFSLMNLHANIKIIIKYKQIQTVRHNADKHSCFCCAKRSSFREINNKLVLDWYLDTGTLGPAYNEQIYAKKTARCRRVLVVTELFYIAVNDFGARKSTRCRRVLVATELVVSGTQCRWLYLSSVWKWTVNLWSFFFPICNNGICCMYIYVLILRYIHNCSFLHNWTEK